MPTKEITEEYTKEELADMRRLVGLIQKGVQATLNKKAAGTSSNPLSASTASSANFRFVGNDTKSTHLWLDDIKTPGEITGIDGIPEDEAWARIVSFEQFRNYLHKHGVPEFISFDFGLGVTTEFTGLDCAKHLVKYCLENKIDKLPQCMSHSSLVSGRQQIEFYLSQWAKHKRLYKEPKTDDNKSVPKIKSR